MKKINHWAAVFLCGLALVAMVILPIASAEARVGGGRSMGFRGSRGFAPRSSYRYTQPQPSRSYSAPQPAQPYIPEQAAPQRGGFLRNMAGGLAGGFLGSMLFNRLGFGSGMGMGTGMGMPGSAGSSGVGFLEILLLAALAYAAYWFFMKRKEEAPRYYNSPVRSFQEENAVDMQSEQRGSNGQLSLDEREVAQVLQRTEPNFILSGFKEQRMDEFLKIQSAWNARDLSSVGDLLSSEMKANLETEVSRLRSMRQINKLENIAVRETELLEAWEEEGVTYATLKIRAQLLDYTVDESSQSLILGDRNQPVKFQEEWTFVRGTGAASSPWKLSAISQMDH